MRIFRQSREDVALCDSLMCLSGNTTWSCFSTRTATCKIATESFTAHLQSMEDGRIGGGEKLVNDNHNLCEWLVAHETSKVGILSTGLFQ